MSDTPAAATAARPTASASIHVAAPQVLPFPAHCGPLLPRKVPVYEQQRLGWGGIKKKKKTPEAYLEKKKKSPRVRVKNEISSEKAQCNVFLCVRVTPSINPEVNLDVRYKAQLQRKGEEGAYSNLQRREKLGILLFSCLNPLFLFDTPVATAIGKHWHRVLFTGGKRKAEGVIILFFLSSFNFSSSL